MCFNLQNTRSNFKPNIFKEGSHFLGFTQIQSSGISRFAFLLGTPIGIDDIMYLVSLGGRPGLYINPVSFLYFYANKIKQH